MGNNSSSMSGNGKSANQDPLPKPPSPPTSASTAASSPDSRPTRSTSTTTNESTVTTTDVGLHVDRHEEKVAVIRRLQPGQGQIFGVQLSRETCDWIREHRTPVATGLASISSTLAAYPLDFIKARMQSYNTKFGVTFRDSFVNEGIRGMYKGCITPIYTIAMVRMISFSAYHNVKHFYDETYKKQFGISPIEMANAKGQYPTIHTVGCFFIAGCCSGAIIPFMAAPFELMKLKAQLAGKMARDNNAPMATIKTGTWGPARAMARERGILSLWKGFQLHLARDTLGTAIYFSVYESVKQTMGVAHGREPTDSGASMTAGLVTGAVSWIFIYPIDVKKTQYQKRYLSGESATEANKSSKVQFFKVAGYRGLGVSVARSALINALFFPVFEQCKKAVFRLAPIGNDDVDDDDDDDDDMD